MNKKEILEKIEQNEPIKNVDIATVAYYVLWESMGRPQKPDSYLLSKFDQWVRKNDFYPHFLDLRNLNRFQKLILQDFDVWKDQDFVTHMWLC